jgi:hypothetical protein
MFFVAASGVSSDTPRSGEAHFPQKFVSSGFSKRHFGQIVANADPFSMGWLKINKEWRQSQLDLDPDLHSKNPDL